MKRRSDRRRCEYQCSKSDILVLYLFRAAHAITHEAFSGVSYSTFVIKVPAGQSVGVDIEELHLVSKHPKSKLYTSNQFAHNQHAISVWQAFGEHSQSIVQTL